MQVLLDVRYALRSFGQTRGLTRGGLVFDRALLRHPELDNELRAGGDCHRIQPEWQPYRIIGVMPRSFTLRQEVMPTLGRAGEAEVLLPLPLGPKASQVRNRLRCQPGDAGDRDPHGARRDPLIR
ncbi:MAG: hypothetical protein ABIS06_20760 [Vicinamibacterales bacterium]